MKSDRNVFIVVAEKRRLRINIIFHKSSSSAYRSLKCPFHFVIIIHTMTSAASIIFLWLAFTRSCSATCRKIGTDFLYGRWKNWALTHPKYCWMIKTLLKSQHFRRMFGLLFFFFNRLLRSRLNTIVIVSSVNSWGLKTGCHFLQDFTSHAYTRTIRLLLYCCLCTHVSVCAWIFVELESREHKEWVSE